MTTKRKIAKRALRLATERAERPGFTKPRIFSPNYIVTKARGPIKRTAATLGGGEIAGASSNGAAQSVAQSPLYYDYRWSTPDKYYFPRNRVVANAIWREVYKRDPAVATATDMYAEMPWSEFHLSAIEDKSIMRIYEDMFNTINILPKLPDFTRDYFITGELVLHNIFNSTKGIWERVIPHNPDYVRIEGAGLAIEQPLLWLMPTPEIKRLLNSTDPRVRKLQRLLPKDVVSAFRANKEVILDSLNTTYLPRLNSSNDVRGTSLYTRLYRIIMYEDFIVNASLAVAQRNAAPLRIFKLGDPNTGWLPDEDDEAAFAEMLSMAEADPLAAIIMHHNVTAELVGVSDRVLLISKEWDFIERVKLMALGVSKSFLVGEASFASAAAGLQTLMARLLSLRMKFENDWLVKKICKPIAEIQEFYRRPQSELDHRIRIKKPLEDAELIIPEFKWRKSLETNEDVATLNIWRDLRERGILSERTYTAGAGVDLETERKNIIEEKKYKEAHPEIYGIPPPATAVMPGAPGAKPGGAPKPPGAPPGPAAPPVPGASFSKYSHFNPYVAKERRERFLSELEAKLYDYARKDRDGSYRVDVDDVLEAVEDVDGELDSVDVNTAIIPTETDLLAGK